MIVIPTQKEYQDLYLQSAQAKATLLGVDVDISNLSDFQIKAAGVAGIASAIVQDAAIQYNNAYPQYSNAQGINLGLSNKGVSAIYPASPAILQLNGDSLVADVNYIIPVGTLITAPNGDTYSVIPSNAGDIEVIINTDANVFYASSISSGTGTTQADTTVLTFTPPIIADDKTSVLSSATVEENTDGSDQESLADATNRLINVNQQPLCSNRAQDLKKLVVVPAEGVTDAQTLTNNQLEDTSGYSNPKINVGIYDISGAPITDAILNLGLINGTTEVVFDRSVSSGIITQSQNTINNQDLAGVFANVNTVSTQGIIGSYVDPNPFFLIQVRLKTGFSLDSQVTLDGNIFTIEQLIQREARRSICQQPYGAYLEFEPTTYTYTSSSFPISAMEQQLDTALGTPTTIGVLGSYLADRVIKVYNVGDTAYEYVPSISLDLGIPTTETDTLPWIYDVATVVGQIYSNIQVEILP